MSIDQLRKDMKESAEALNQLAGGLGKPPPTPTAIVEFLRNTMWPTMEAAVDELGQLDECVEDIYNASEDILQPETAQLFAALVVAGRVMAAELAKRLTNTAADAEAKAIVDGFLEMASAAERAIQEITVPETDDDEDDEDDEEEEGKPT